MAFPVNPTSQQGTPYYTLPVWSPPSTPQSTATAWRYRRTTHDAQGVSQISKKQQEVWATHWPIGCCVSDTEWRTVLEITAAAKGYVETHKLKMLVSEDSVRAALTALEGEKLIESKYGETVP